MQNGDTQTQKAYEQLETMIMLKELVPGEMYSENQLAERLGFGRTPIREALQRLSYERMVTIQPRRGVQIPEVSVETQVKLLEVRREVEKLCVRLAALRASTAQKHRMQVLSNAILEYAENQNESDFLRTLKEIHTILLDASGNEYLKQAMLPLQGLSRRFWFSNLEKRQSKIHPATLHADVLRAVIHADENAAEEASKKLIDYLIDFAYSTIPMDKEYGA